MYVKCNSGGNSSIVNYNNWNCFIEKKFEQNKKTKTEFEKFRLFSIFFSTFFQLFFDFLSNSGQRTIYRVSATAGHRNTIQPHRSTITHNPGL